MGRKKPALSSTQWERVKILLYEASMLEEPERSEYLRKTCRVGDPVGDEVEALLSREGVTTFLDGPPVCNLPKLLDEADPQRLVGERIEKYRIHRWVASGGMSDVYEVVEERAGNDGRRAALKLLRRASASAISIERFAQEQKVLASLDHPYIAGYLGQGVAENGQHYLILEYVEGAPITDFCRDGDLGLRERLVLFSRVCEAVEVAHTRSIVHRDLKPSNILVQEDGTPKLLDFGGVKVLESTPELDALVTVDPSSLPYTLAYASPEMIRGQLVSTRSDVFSLGLVLYELLTGCRAFSPSKISPFQLARAICEEDPLPAQTALRGVIHPREARRKNSNPSPDVSSGFRPSYSRISRDLEAILCKALRKDPDRRYSSVGGLREDLVCFLEGRRVAARKETYPVRLSKFVGRHRLLLGVGSSLVAVLIAGGVGAYWGWIGSRTEREAVVAAESRVSDVLRFLEDVLVPKEEFRRGKETTLDEVVEYAKGGIAVCEDPSTKAAIHRVLGRIYARFGNPVAARAELKIALDLRSAERGDEDEETIESLGELISLCLDAGDLDSAADELARLKGMVFKEDLPSSAGGREEGLRSAEVWMLEGRLLDARGVSDGARGAYEKALAACPSGIGEEAQIRGMTLFNLSGLERELRNYAEAEDRLEEAITVLEEAGAHGHVLGLCQNQRGLIHQALGKVEAAESSYRAAIATHRQSSGIDHPEVARVSFNLATLLEDLGKREEARLRYEDSLRVLRSVFGGAHRDVLVVRNRLGTLLFREGQVEKSEVVFEEGLAAVRAKGNPLDLAFLLGGWALVLRDQGRFEAASQCYEEVLGIHEQHSGKDHPSMGRHLANASLVLIERQNFELAESHLARALEILEPTVEPEDVRVLQVRAILAKLLYRAGRFLESEAVLREVLEAARGSSRTPGSLRAQLDLRMAEVLTSLQRFGEAERHARKATSFLRRSLRPGHLLVAYAETVFGEVLFRRGLEEEGLSLTEQGYATLKRSPQVRNGQARRAWSRLLWMHRERGASDEEAELRNELAELLPPG